MPRTTARDLLERQRAASTWPPRRPTFAELQGPPVVVVLERRRRARARALFAAVLIGALLGFVLLAWGA